MSDTTDDDKVITNLTRKLVRLEEAKMVKGG